MALIGLLILLIIIGCVIIRPFGVDVSIVAVIGAVILGGLGLFTLPMLQTIIADTWDASLTLIALFILSESLGVNNFFEWAGIRLANLAHGSGIKLYFLILGLTALTTALLANDGAILMLTPILVSVVGTIYTDKKHFLPFLFATGFLADAFSSFFLPSNLTNIIIATTNNLSFVPTFLHLLPVNLVVLLTVGGLFFLRFHSTIKQPFDPKKVSVSKSVIKDPIIFWVSWILLGVLIVGYIIGGQFQWPFALVALPVSLVMLGLVSLRKLEQPQVILKAAPWNVLVYALAMFVVVSAVFEAGSLQYLTQFVQHLAARPALLTLVQLGGTFGLLSAFFNNLPATLVGVLSLPHAPQPVVYAQILGVNIGPKLTPFGSLATLLWLQILDKKGIQISWVHYFKENWWVTILTLSAALVSLSLLPLK